MTLNHSQQNPKKISKNPQKTSKNLKKKKKEYEEEDESSKFATETFDRLSLALRGKTLIPLLFSFIPTFLNSPNWKLRHAALSTLSSAAEGSRSFFLSSLSSLLSFVLPRLQDTHSRVRWAACNTLGQMCTDFAPTLQVSFSLLPLLLISFHFFRYVTSLVV